MKDQESGFLNINKESGMTSHDVVNQLRRITGIKKIGHSGTLDPFASGVLVCAVGRDATKKIREFLYMDKEYIAEIFLGAETDTYDRTGHITWNMEHGTSDVKVYHNLSQQDIKKNIFNFIGPQKQVPPMYSAVKREGKKLYELAREGKTIERGFSEIEIHEIEILDYQFPILKLRVKCSSGTYIRSLAHDIGKELGCGAYLKELERTKVGEFKVEKAVSLEDLNEGNWQDKLEQLKELRFK